MHANNVFSRESPFLCWIILKIDGFCQSPEQWWTFSRAEQHIPPKAGRQREAIGAKIVPPSFSSQIPPATSCKVNACACHAKCIRMKVLRLPRTVFQVSISIMLSVFVAQDISKQICGAKVNAQNSTHVLLLEMPRLDVAETPSLLVSAHGPVLDLGVYAFHGVPLERCLLRELKLSHCNQQNQMGPSRTSNPEKLLETDRNRISMRRFREFQMGL